jgi:S-layer protein (TIGR01567 family)
MEACHIHKKAVRKVNIITMIIILSALFTGTCYADSVEVRGNVLDSGNLSSVAWDGLNWSGLYFSLNDVGSNTEILYYQNINPENPAIGQTSDNNVIDKEELIYSTHSYNKKFKLSAKTAATGVSTYSIIPWFGKKYIAVDDDARKITTIITEQGGDAEKDLKEGESWDLGKGYSLELNQLDADAGKAFVILYKNGVKQASDVLEMESTDNNRAFIAKDNFAGLEDAVYFVTYLKNTFRSSSESFAIFKYTWLIDKDNVTIIEDGDKFGSLKCRDVSKNGINMSNYKVITLEMDDKTYFAEDWYFRTSKAGKGINGGYLFYPAMNVVFDTPVVVQASSPSESDAPSDNASLQESTNTTEDLSSTTDISGKESYEKEHLPLDNTPNNAGIPGFISITAISGLVAANFILRHGVD